LGEESDGSKIGLFTEWELRRGLATWATSV